MVKTRQKAPSVATKRRVEKNRMRGELETSRMLGEPNGKEVKKGRKKAPTETIVEREGPVLIPQLQQGTAIFYIVGDRPLMVNNKLNVAERIAEQYSGSGKTKKAKLPDLTPDEQYANAFYVLPDSKFAPPSPKGRYGVPCSGIKKCACSAIRTTGITDNTTIGLIAKSFWVMEDAGGLCLIKSKKIIRDVRTVNIGSGQKTVPSMRHRPTFMDWEIKLHVKFNAVVLSEEQLVNLFMHAGQYIGLCEMRAEKKQGACGGFVVRSDR